MVSAPPIADSGAARNALMITQLIAAAKLTRALVGTRLSDLGLQIGQDDMLVALSTNGGKMMMSHLADALEVRSSTVSKMSDRLERDGFVERGLSESDRRVTFVALTERGLSMKLRIDELRASMSEEIKSELGRDRSSTTAGELAAVTEVLTSSLRRLR